MGGFRRYALYGEDQAVTAPEFVHIETISARSSRHDWTIRPHTHPGIFQLLFIERGGGTFSGDAVEQELSAPALVALPSGSIHAFAFSQGAEGWVLSIASDLLVGLMIDGACHVGRPRLGNEVNQQAARRLSWLLNEVAEDLAPGLPGALPPSVRATLALVLAIADGVLAASRPVELVPVGAQARHEELVQRFRALVDRTLREGWPVSRYAAQLGTTQPTLTRACRLVLQRSPGHILLDRALLEAMRALTYTSASVSQIADDLGFADPAYFARFFKARTGMTATAFRRNRAWLQPAASA